MLLELAATVMPSEMAVRKLSRLLRPVCVVLDLSERAASLKSIEDAEGRVRPVLLSVELASLAVWYADVEGIECSWKEGLRAGEGSGSLGGGNGGGPREASDAEARKDRFECERARRVCTGVAFDALEGECAVAVAVGVRRSASELCFASARAAEVEAARRITAESDAPSLEVEPDVFSSETFRAPSGTRLTAAPLLVALSGVSGNGSSGE